ncbi:hypothetical protein [Mailhella sp.]
MCLIAFFILVVSLVCAYLGIMHFTGLEADALKGAAVIGTIIFVIVIAFGWKKSGKS